MDIRPIEETSADYLRDESRRQGRAERVAWPESEEDLVEAVSLAVRQAWPVTTQGARTGITAGAVPEGGLVINLNRMRSVLGLTRDADTGLFHLTVQPGLPLAELRESLARKQFDIAQWDAASRAALDLLQQVGPVFFTPDPTETTASIGGMAACNASGTRSFAYGAMRRCVPGLRAVTAGGHVLDLRRGLQRARGRRFRVSATDGASFEGPLPSYAMPRVKNASGYFAEDDMDLVDLMIGSEGTLGVFSAVTLLLRPEPPVIWGLVAFLPDEPQALRFVRLVRAGVPEPGVTPPPGPAALEYFDARSLRLVRQHQEAGAASWAFPSVPAKAGSAVYAELHARDEDAATALVERWSADLAACGGGENDTWMAMDAHEIKKLHEFRHAVPEVVNRTIDERRLQEPRLTKLGTDMAVPDEHLERIMAMYHADLASAELDYVVFGHIGNNHVHVNILPHSLDEYERGRSLYMQWAGRVVALGGTVSAEHGIGKLKTELLKTMYGAQGIEEMRAVKRVFDPGGWLNRGTLFKPA